MTIGEGFGERLGLLRRERGVQLKRDLSQAEVARALKIPPTTYSRLEAGSFKRSPELDTLKALAKYFGVTLGWLWFGEGERTPSIRGEELVAEPAPPRRAGVPAKAHRKGAR